MPNAKCLLRYFARRGALGALLSALCFSTSSSAQVDSLGTVHVIYSARVLTNINQSDAQAAIELWVREVMHSLDVVVQPKITFIDRLQDILDAIDNNRADLINLNVMEYLELQHALDPILISSQAEKPLGQYIVLVRRDAGIERLLDLQNRRLTLEASISRGAVSMLWFEVELLRAGLKNPDPTAFFSQIDEVNKTMAAVLPVLLGQADAAIVQKSNFSTLAEVNPQLQREMTALLSSPPLLPAVSCVPRGMDQERRRIMQQSSLRLSSTTRGAQIMALFGVDELHPFRPELLASIEALIAEHTSLSADLAAEKNGEKNK